METSDKVAGKPVVNLQIADPEIFNEVWHIGGN